MPALPQEIVLDPNLLLLLFVGSFEPRTLGLFKRLSGFDAKDLGLLQEITQTHRSLVTPHLLTEVSNLANGLPENLRQGFHRYLSVYVVLLREVFIEAVQLRYDKTFSLFGLADAAVSSLSANTLVVTEDGRLRDFLLRQRRKVIGLSELRRAAAGLPTH